MKMIGYRYQSCFGPYIEKFIQEKRASGYAYGSEEWKLKHFDAFCVEERIMDLCLSRELIQKWGILREGEALSTCSARTSVLRQFALFLTASGIDAYIPSRFYRSEKRVVHVLSDPEVAALFQEVDTYAPAIKVPQFLRLAVEYKVVFRLIYCCGLRLSEARKLQWTDVDLEQGNLHIFHSKGRKDRLVYMERDLVDLLRTYLKALQDHFHCISEWVFPARDPEKCLTNGTIDARFRQCWQRTAFSHNCDKAPTVHCLRHGFVIKRLNRWMEDGIQLKEMLPFLSRYLGHVSPDETFYYYHQVEEAFRIIRSRDKTGRNVIPEVPAHE